MRDQLPCHNEQHPQHDTRANQPEGSANGSMKAVPMKRKDAALFRQKYVSALNKLQRWNAGDALDFQSDLQMYEEIIARAAAPRRCQRASQPQRQW